MKLFYSGIFLILLFGCATYVNHPVTGEKIAIPPNMVNKIDFDLTIYYASEASDKINSGKIIQQFQAGGMALEITSIDPLIAKSQTNMVLGNLLIEAGTIARISINEIEKGTISIFILPTYSGAPAGSIQRWILIKSRETLIIRINKLLNPIGYFYIEERSLMASPNL